MDSVEVETLIYLPPAEVFDFLVDFPRYADYSKHLRDVDQTGDAGPGTRYALTFTWWKVRYTAHTEVTGVDPPHTLTWRVVRDVSARGHWQVDPAPDAAPADRETASRVTLAVTFDPDSAGPGLLDLPRFVSTDWVVERVTGLVRAEGERVVERIVADLEGEPRDVDLRVTVDGG